MISESREARQRSLENTLRSLLYRRLIIEREKEDIDRSILQVEGAMNENEAVRRDINTQAVLDQSKPQPQPEEKKNG